MSTSSSSTALGLGVGLAVGVAAGAKLALEYQKRQQERELNPPAPDYGSGGSWHANHAFDGGDTVASWVPTVVHTAEGSAPSGLSCESESAEADVFFVHATTCFRGVGNADMDEAPRLDANPALPENMAELQVGKYASAFNGCCRIYAPKYRQARCNNYHVMSGSRGDAGDAIPDYGYAENAVGQDAFAVALGDVKRAFGEYIERWNNGRPFVLAGHSQGSAHLVHLLQALEREDPKVLERMVCAYLPGTQLGVRSFEALKPVENADDTGQVWMGWCSVAAGDSNDGKSIACGRNRSGYADGTVTLAEEPQDKPTSHCLLDFSGEVAPRSKGAVMWDDEGLYPDAYECEGVKNGFLSVQVDETRCGALVQDLAHGDYHVLDFMLYWRDIREDVSRRVALVRAKRLLSLHGVFSVIDMSPTTGRTLGRRVLQ